MDEAKERAITSSLSSVAHAQYIWGTGERTSAGKHKVTDEHFNWVALEHVVKTPTMYCIVCTSFSRARLFVA